MKTIFLIIFITFLYLTSVLLIEERKIKETFDNLYQIKKNYKNACLYDTTTDYFRCRILEGYNHQQCQLDNVTRIAFGSCNSQFKNQEFWQRIINFKPSLWIWLGDNIYADYFPKEFKKDDIIKIITKENKYLEHMEDQYLKLLNNKHYKDFLNSGIKITGIWDDHDYYRNNKGDEISNKNKIRSKKIFFDFINFNKYNTEIEKPFDSKEGIYRNYFIKSDNGINLVNVFLLDCRSFKTRNDILGRKQWIWLENELKKSDAKLNLIVSGIQIIADRKDDTESWSSIGDSRIKLMQMLNCVNKKNTLILSGDIHQSCVKSNYGFIEITSSPLSNFISKFKYANKNNIGEFITIHNYGFLEIHWTSNYEIDKIITGFNNTNNNESSNVLEIK